MFVSHLQLAPTLKPTPAPVEPVTEVPVPAPEVPVSTTAPEPDNLTPDETQPPAGSEIPATDDNFSALYPGVTSSAYIHSNSVTALIAVGSAMVCTLAVFM